MGVDPNGPNPFPCGGSGQPSCPPQPAVARTVNAILAADGDAESIAAIVTNALQEHGHNVHAAAKG